MRALVDKYNSLGEAQKKRGLIASLIVLGLIGIWLSSQEDTESAGPLIPPEIITPVSSNIYVHVVGEVSAPGHCQLPVGSRASDAIAMAGGLTTLAAQESINLARILSHGEQLSVLSIEAMASGNIAGKVSLNRGDRADFESLSGIGPATSEKIIKYREESGARPLQGVGKSSSATSVKVMLH